MAILNGDLPDLSFGTAPGISPEAFFFARVPVRAFAIPHEQIEQPVCDKNAAVFASMERFFIGAESGEVELMP